MGVEIPDSSLHFKVLWRSHKSWILSVPSEFHTSAHFGLALSVATFAFLYDRESLGLGFLLIFHCLLRPGKAHSMEWIDIHIFEDNSASRYEGVFLVW